VTGRTVAVSALAELRRAAVIAMARCPEDESGQQHHWSALRVEVSLAAGRGQPMRAELACLRCGAGATLRFRT
jgi:hypothetical protein